MPESSLLVIDGSGTTQRTAQDVDSSGFLVPRHSLTNQGAPIALTNPLPVSLVVGSAAAGPTNAVPIAPPPATPVAASTLTITTANVGQTLFAAGTISRGYRVQNPSTATESLFVDDATTPSLTSGTTIEIQPGGYYESPVPPSGAVQIMAATAGHAFRAARW